MRSFSLLSYSLKYFATALRSSAVLNGQFHLSIVRPDSCIIASQLQYPLAARAVAFTVDRHAAAVFAEILLAVLAAHEFFSLFISFLLRFVALRPIVLRTFVQAPSSVGRCRLLL
jgi:hypothetical protein